jgi:hypothetical protein
MATPTMRTVARLFVLPWYLVGWILHVCLGLLAPEVYQAFGSTAVLPGFGDLWGRVVMPHISLFALLLAGFELTVALLLLSGGRRFRVGVALSIAFNVFLVQLGLGYPAGGLADGFVVNRLPNLVMVAIQVPLLFGPEARPMREVVRGWMGGLRTQS